VAAGAPAAPSGLKDLGIEVNDLTAETAQRYGYKVGQGVLITGVDPAGLGASTGLKSGMLILQVMRQDVTSVAELKKALGKADLAKGITMLVRAGDRQMFILLKKQ